MGFTRRLTHTMAIAVLGLILASCAPGFEVNSSMKLLSESESSVLEITSEEAAEIIGKGFWSHLDSSLSEPASNSDSNSDSDSKSNSNSDPDSNSDSNPASPKFTYYDITIKTPYGKIFAPIAKRVDALAPTICTSLGYGTGASSYGTHEYACGTPIDNNWKNLLSLDIDEVGSSRVDLQACKLEYSIVSPK